MNLNSSCTFSTTLGGCVSRCKRAGGHIFITDSSSAAVGVEEMESEL